MPLERLVRALIKTSQDIISRAIQIGVTHIHTCWIRVQIARTLIDNIGQHVTTAFFGMKGQQFRNRPRTGKREKQVFGVKSNIAPRPRQMWHEGIYCPFNTIIRECIDINGGHLRQSIVINTGK